MEDKKNKTLIMGSNISSAPIFVLFLCFFLSSKMSSLICYIKARCLQVSYSLFFSNFPTCFYNETFLQLANISCDLAGATGGGRANNPQWVRIFSLTTGSVMGDMNFMSPPQWRHFDMSISKTLAKRLFPYKSMLTCLTWFLSFQ